MFLITQIFKKNQNYANIFHLLQMEDEFLDQKMIQHLYFQCLASKVRRKHYFSRASSAFCKNICTICVLQVFSCSSLEKVIFFVIVMCVNFGFLFSLCNRKILIGGLTKETTLGQFLNPATCLYIVNLSLLMRFVFFNQEKGQIYPCSIGKQFIYALRYTLGPNMPLP